MYVCAHVWMYAMCVCWRRPEEDIGVPKARAIGGGELPDVGAGSQMQVLRKGRSHRRTVHSLNC